MVWFWCINRESKEPLWKLLLSTVSVPMCHGWKLLGGLHWDEPARKSVFYEARNGTHLLGDQRETNPPAGSQKTHVIAQRLILYR